MIYFTSDLHFCDKYTFTHDDRPFKNVKQCDKFILKTINKTVQKNDTLYIVGDLMDSDNLNNNLMKTAESYIKKIKANVILIIGNNEKRIIKRMFNDNFLSFKNYCLSIGIKDVKYNEELSFGGYDFYLTHEPIDHKADKINLFGHVHRSKGIWQTFGLNISCDINHFRPYSQKDILFQLKEKEYYWPQDKNLQLL